MKKTLKNFMAIICVVLTILVNVLPLYAQSSVEFRPSDEYIDISQQELVEYTAKQTDGNTVDTLGVTKYVYENKTYVEGAVKNTRYYAPDYLKDIEGDYTTPGYVPDHVDELLSTYTAMENDSSELMSDVNILSAAAVSCPGIIGSDDRTKLDYSKDTVNYPNIQTIHLKFYDTDGKMFTGSGFVIGPDVYVTAGHCVYNKKNDNFYTLPEVRLMQNGTSLSSSYYSTRNRTWATAYAKPDGDENYDWAIMRTQGWIGQEVGWFGLGTSENNKLNKSDIYIAGYPANQPTYGLTGLEWYLHYSNGPTLAGLFDKYSNYYVMSYKMDQTGGQSGGPAYTVTYENGNLKSWHAWGIVTRVRSTANPDGSYKETVINEANRLTATLYSYCVGAQEESLERYNSSR